MILQAQHCDGPEYAAAMNRCIVGYWKPVFFFLRAKGKSQHAAEDLTQEFFLKFFERRWIGPADPGRGRFRTFLLTILTRFLADQGPQRAPRQKTFDDRVISVSSLIGDDDRSFDPPLYETPETIFMKQWAHALVAIVRHRLETWCLDRGRPDWYRIFSAAHFAPSGQSRATQHELAEQCGLSRDQIRYALTETQEMFIALLRHEVGEQVGTDAELDVEIRELQNLLGM